MDGYGMVTPTVLGLGLDRMNVSWAKAKPLVSASIVSRPRNMLRSGNSRFWLRAPDD
jgi:hypothetical protein